MIIVYSIIFVSFSAIFITFSSAACAQRKRTNPAESAATKTRKTSTRGTERSDTTSEGGREKTLAVPSASELAAAHQRFLAEPSSQDSSSRREEEKRSKNKKNKRLMAATHGSTAAMNSSVRTAMPRGATDDGKPSVSPDSKVSGAPLEKKASEQKIQSEALPMRIAADPLPPPPPPQPKTIQLPAPAPVPVAPAPALAPAPVPAPAAAPASPAPPAPIPNQPQQPPLVKKASVMKAAVPSPVPAPGPQAPAQPMVKLEKKASVMKPAATAPPPEKKASMMKVPAVPAAGAAAAPPTPAQPAVVKIEKKASVMKVAEEAKKEDVLGATTPEDENKKPHVTVDLPEIAFTAAATNQSKFAVKNIHDKKVMFKIKVSENVTFLVNPVHGCLEPGKSINVTVTHKKSGPLLAKLVIVNSVMTGEEKDIATTFKTLTKPTGGPVNVKLVAK